MRVLSNRKSDRKQRWRRRRSVASAPCVLRGTTVFFIIWKAFAIPLKITNGTPFPFVREDKYCVCGNKWFPGKRDCSTWWTQFMLSVDFFHSRASHINFHFVCHATGLWLCEDCEDFSAIQLATFIPCVPFCNLVQLKAHCDERLRICVNERETMPRRPKYHKWTTNFSLGIFFSLPSKEWQLSANLIESQQRNQCHSHLDRSERFFQDLRCALQFCLFFRFHLGIIFALLFRSLRVIVIRRNSTAMIPSSWSRLHARLQTLYDRLNISTEHWCVLFI